MVLGGPVVYSNGGSANKFYDGLLSDVRFFDSALTAQEVDAVFNDSSSPEFAITAVVLEDNGDVTLTWNSQPGASYTIYYSEDLINFDGDVGDGFIASPDEATTTKSFENPLPDSDFLFFRVGQN